VTGLDTACLAQLAPIAFDLTFPNNERRARSQRLVPSVDQV
jgi:hypothetical protein